MQAIVNAADVNCLRPIDREKDFWSSPQRERPIQRNGTIKVKSEMNDRGVPFLELYRPA